MSCLMAVSLYVSLPLFFYVLFSLNFSVSQNVTCKNVYLAIAMFVVIYHEWVKNKAQNLDDSTYGTLVANNH